MTSRPRVLILGTGAQAKYALETFRLTKEVEIAGLVELAARAGGPPELGAPVLGGLDLLDELLDRRADAAIICCADSRTKAGLHARMRARGTRLVSSVHPRACIATSARLGEGVIVNACAVVQPYARLGEGAMIHAGVVVEHDNDIGAFANLAPGVRLAGWVRIGAHARVFTGATVIPKVHIGEAATVGAGAVVLRDVEAGSTVVGVPARSLVRGGASGVAHE